MLDYKSRRDAVIEAKTVVRRRLVVENGEQIVDEDPVTLTAAFDMTYGIAMGVWHELHRIADALEKHNTLL